MPELASLSQWRDQCNKPKSATVADLGPTAPALERDYASLSARQRALRALAQVAEDEL